MATRFNDRLLLWGLGVLQPAGASHVLEYLKAIFSDIQTMPTLSQVEDYFIRWEKMGFIVNVDKTRVHLYSLTTRGNAILPADIRRNRDKARLFLLNEARTNRISLSREDVRDLVGVAPTVDGSRDDTRARRPINTTVVLAGRIYWPSVFKQLKNKVGPLKASLDTLFLEFYSYPSIESISEANPELPTLGNVWLHRIALAIGISPRLIGSIIHKKEKHYRSFTIGKKGGGQRTINSPRIFLKVIQGWIMDYMLSNLTSHPSCHSYQRGKSIITNAEKHTGKRYVANIDIENYFGSITYDHVKKLLPKFGFEKNAASLLAKIVTYEDVLPQGACTSPIISNLYLFDFDALMSEYAKSKNLTYTRYADDLTVSGDDRDAIQTVINKISAELVRHGLKINQKKTRIANRGGQQRVTGVVVNEKALPPRKFRRKIRAMIHNASKHPKTYASKYDELNGYVGHLMSFSALNSDGKLNEYVEIRKSLRINRKRQ